MNKQKILDFEDLLRNEDNAIKMAEFLGWLLGDGCISVTKKYSECAITGDLIEEYPFYHDIVLPTFNNLFNQLLGRLVFLKEYKSNGVCGLYVFDKQFVELLQNKFTVLAGKKLNVRIPEFIQSYKQKVAFLRGLFDTDGSIYYCKSNVKTKNVSCFSVFHYKPKIKLATISKLLIREVYTMLRELGYHPRWRKPFRQRVNENVMYGVVLYRNEDVVRWIKDIGFKNLKHLSKVEVCEKYGFCPPSTKLNQRLSLIDGSLCPLSFYPGCDDLSLEFVKCRLFKGSLSK